MPFSLAALPKPVLIGAPIAGVGLLAAILWYEFIYKKTPAAGSLAPVGAPPPPATVPVKATAPPPAVVATAHPGQVVLRAPPGMPKIGPNGQLGLFAWGNLQTLPKTFPNDPSGIYHGLAVAALQTIQQDPTAATLIDQIAALSTSTNPGITALAAKLQTFPTAGLN